MNAENLDVNYDYILTFDDSSDVCNKDGLTRLDRYIKEDVDSCIHNIALDNYLAHIGKIDSDKFNDYVTKFDIDHIGKKNYKEDSIKKAFDYLISYYDKHTLYVYFTNDAYLLDGPTSECIYIILNNSKDLINGENSYILDFINYMESYYEKERGKRRVL